jgi:hypothetical protein
MLFEGQSKGMREIYKRMYDAISINKIIERSKSIKKREKSFK